MNYPVICALDTSNLRQAMQWLEELNDEIDIVKIGPEFFTSAGLYGLLAITQKTNVFLDLKFHDIPNTVSKTIQNFQQFRNIKMLTIHASGDAEMIKCAVEAAEKIDVIAVTVLTSTREKLDTIEEVKRLTEKALSNNAAGIVCSSHEVKILREEFGNDFKIVVPGIRPSWYALEDDQSRTGTPLETLKDGADYIVIGRPITSSDNIYEASTKVINEIRNQIT